MCQPHLPILQSSSYAKLLVDIEPSGRIKGEGHPLHSGLSRRLILATTRTTCYQNHKHMGVSENSVPLNPMVNDHYPYEMAIIGNIPHFQVVLMLKMGPEFMGTRPREHINMHRLHRWSFFANLEDLIRRVYTSPAYILLMMSTCPVPSSVGWWPNPSRPSSSQGMALSEVKILRKKNPKTSQNQVFHGISQKLLWWLSKKSSGTIATAWGSLRQLEDAWGDMKPFSHASPTPGQTV